jgi:hypothetical protein
MLAFVLAVLCHTNTMYPEDNKGTDIVPNNPIILYPNFLLLFPDFRHIVLAILSQFLGYIHYRLTDLLLPVFLQNLQPMSDLQICYPILCVDIV